MSWLSNPQSGRTENQAADLNNDLVTAQGMSHLDPPFCFATFYRISEISQLASSI
jgi:hypothetical protein